MTAPVDIGTLIVSTPEIAGGRPRIAGTGISVDQLAALSKQGFGPEEIVAEKYPHLMLAQVYAALTYYHANQTVIEASLAANALAYEEWKAEERRRRGDP